MSEIIKVGMADLKTCVSPDGVTTLGLRYVTVARILQNLRIRELMNWCDKWRKSVREKQEWSQRLPAVPPCSHSRAVTT